MIREGKIFEQKPPVIADMAIAHAHATLIWVKKVAVMEENTQEVDWKS
jgi:hypothetical protein